MIFCKLDAFSIGEITSSLRKKCQKDLRLGSNFRGGGGKI